MDQHDVDMIGSSSSSIIASNEDVPWIEKYRPRNLGDVVGNEETVARLKVIAQDGNMPNLIISGPPGTGKTTSVLCLAHELLGESYREGVLELNASDDRGIDVVRNQIKMFAQKKISLPVGIHKIIILDEADSMTPAAQQALRRTMELYASSTRFALACNQSSKVIEPIQSRCAILRYTRLSDQQMRSRVIEICRSEGVPFTEEGLDAIIFSAEGDMRQAINNVQATFSGFNVLTADNVFKVCDQPHPTIARRILESCQQGRVDESYNALNELWQSGYSSEDIVATLFRVVKNLTEMPDYLKLEFIKEIGITHMRICDGVQTFVQLSGLTARLCRIAGKSEESIIFG